MRYVNISQLRTPNGWIQRAQVARTAVARGADPDDYAAVWRAVKGQLAGLLHDKCWYCECYVTRSDNAVDHFRPKGRVSDAKRKHSGYRWLAFEPSNFRYACTYCNSRRKGIEGGTTGGKGDRFPLLDESKRVYQAGPVDDEEPMLLDPCVFSDCELLGCQKENGNSCAASTVATDKTRAEDSIEIYHLNYEPTCKQRHGKAIGFLAKLEEAKRKFELTQIDPDKRGEFLAQAGQLHQDICAGAEFSGEMRFLMRGERNKNHPWIQQLLEA